MRKVIKVLDEVTETTTSNPVSILGAEKVTLLCERADHGSGSSTFAAQVGVGSHLADYNRWDSNVTHTNVESDTSVNELVLSADGVDFLSMSPKDVFEHIVIKVTEDTDGTHSAWLIIDYKDDFK
jgi:hypothetical protein